MEELTHIYHHKHIKLLQNLDSSNTGIPAQNTSFLTHNNKILHINDHSQRDILNLNPLIIPKKYSSLNSSHETPANIGMLHWINTDITRKVFISFEGLVAVSLSDNAERVVGNIGFTSGFHFWEIICPYDSLDLSIGVLSIEGKEVVQTFKCSSARVITVELDLNKNLLSFWLNGCFQPEKSLQLYDSEWKPCINLLAKQKVVYLNPFAVHPKTKSTSTYANNISLSMLHALGLIGNSVLILKKKNKINKITKDEFDNEISKIKFDALELLVPMNQIGSKAILLTFKENGLNQFIQQYGSTTQILHIYHGAKLAILCKNFLESSATTDETEIRVGKYLQKLFCDEKSSIQISECLATIKDEISKVINLKTSLNNETKMIACDNLNLKFIDKTSMLMIEDENAYIIHNSSRSESTSYYRVKLIGPDTVYVVVNKNEFFNMIQYLDTDEMAGKLCKASGLRIQLFNTFKQIIETGECNAQTFSFTIGLSSFYIIVKLLIICEQTSFEEQIKLLSQISDLLAQSKEGFGDSTQGEKSKEDEILNNFSELPNLFREEPLTLEEIAIEEAKGKQEAELKSKSKIRKLLEEKQLTKYKISLTEHYKILQCLLKIEECLFAASASSQQSLVISCLTASTSRLHTTFGRFLSYSNVQYSAHSPIELAENGLFLRSFLTGEIFHFSNAEYPIDISNENIEVSLGKQIPFSNNLLYYNRDYIPAYIFTLSYSGVRVPKTSNISFNQEDKLLIIIDDDATVRVYGVSLLPVKMITFNARRDNLQDEFHLLDAGVEVLEIENENYIDKMNATIGTAAKSEINLDDPIIYSIVNELEEIGIPVEHALKCIITSNLRTSDDILNYITKTLNKEFEEKKNAFNIRSTIKKDHWECEYCYWSNNYDTENCEACGVTATLSAYYTEEDINQNNDIAVKVEKFLELTDKPKIDENKELQQKIIKSGQILNISCGRISKNILDSLVIQIVIQDENNRKVIRTVRLTYNPDFVHRFLDFEEIRNKHKPRYVENQVFESVPTFLRHASAPLLSYTLPTILNLNGQIDLLLPSDMNQKITEIISSNTNFVVVLAEKNKLSIVGVPIKNTRFHPLVSNKNLVEDNHTVIGKNFITKEFKDFVIYKAISDKLFILCKTDNQYLLHVAHISDENIFIRTISLDMLGNSSDIIDLNYIQHELIILCSNDIFILNFKELNDENFDELTSKNNSTNLNNSSEESTSMLANIDIDKMIMALHHNEAAKLYLHQSTNCNIMQENSKHIALEVIDPEKNVEAEINFSQPLKILDVYITLGVELKSKQDSLISFADSISKFDSNIKSADTRNEVQKSPENIVISPNQATLLSLTQQCGIRAASNDNNTTTAESSTDSLLPLTLQTIQGFSLAHPSPQFDITNMFDPSESTIAALKYPAQDIIFKHLHNEAFIINSIIIKSPLDINDSRINCQPVISGLIYFSMHLAHFSHIRNEFSTMEASNLLLWLKKKRESGTPWMPWEPAGIFTLGKNETFTRFELFDRSPAKYILLRPTKMRANWVANNISACLTFFGVSGNTSLRDYFDDKILYKSLDLPLDRLNNLALPNAQQNYSTCKKLKVIAQTADSSNCQIYDNEVYVNSVIINDMILNVSDFYPLSYQFPLSGRAIIKIPGINVKGGNVSKLSVNLDLLENIPDWIVKSISIEVLIERGSSHTSSTISNLLDINKYHSHLNEYVKLLMDNQFDKSKKITIIRLLNELIVKEPLIISKLVEEIEIEKFLYSNLNCVEQQDVYEIQTLLNHLHTVGGNEFVLKLQNATKNIISMFSSLKCLSYFGLQILWKILFWSASFCDWPSQEKHTFLVNNLIAQSNIKKDMLKKYDTYTSYQLLKKLFPSNNYMSFESHLFGPEFYECQGQKQQIFGRNQKHIPSILLKAFEMPNELKKELIIDLGSPHKITKIKLYFEKLQLVSTFILKIYAYDHQNEKVLLDSRLINESLVRQLTYQAHTIDDIGKLYSVDEINALIFTPPSQMLCARYIVCEVHTTLVSGLKLLSTVYPEKTKLIILPQVFGKKVQVSGYNSIQQFNHIFDNDQNIQNVVIKSGASPSFIQSCSNNGYVLIRSDPNEWDEKNKIQREENNQLQISNRLKLEGILKEKQKELKNLLIKTSEKLIDKTAVEKLCKEIEDLQIQLQTNHHSNYSKNFLESLDTISTFSRVILSECLIQFHNEKNIDAKFLELLIDEFIIPESGIIFKLGMQLFTNLIKKLDKENMNTLNSHILKNYINKFNGMYSIDTLVNILQLCPSILQTIILDISSKISDQCTLQKLEIVNGIGLNMVLVDKLLDLPNNILNNSVSKLTANEIIGTFCWIFSKSGLSKRDKTALSYLICGVLLKVFKKNITDVQDFINFYPESEQIILIYNSILFLENEKLKSQFCEFITLPISKQSAIDSSSAQVKTSYYNLINMLVEATNNVLSDRFAAAVGHEADYLLGILKNFLPCIKSMKKSQKLKPARKLSISKKEITLSNNNNAPIQLSASQSQNEPESANLLVKDIFILKPEVLKKAIDAICSNKFSEYPEVINKTFHLIIEASSLLADEPEFIQKLIKTFLAGPENLRFGLLDNLSKIIESFLICTNSYAIQNLLVTYIFESLNKLDCKEWVIAHKFINLLLYRKIIRTSTDVNSFPKALINEETVELMLNLFSKYLWEHINLGGVDGAMATPVNIVQKLVIANELIKTIQCAVTSNGIKTINSLFMEKDVTLVDTLNKIFIWLCINRNTYGTVTKSPSVDAMNNICTGLLGLFDTVSNNEKLSTLFLEKMQESVHDYEKKLDEYYEIKEKPLGTVLVNISKNISSTFEEIAIKLLKTSKIIDNFVKSQGSQTKGLRHIFMRLTQPLQNVQNLDVHKLEEEEIKLDNLFTEIELLPILKEPVVGVNKDNIASTDGKYKEEECANVIKFIPHPLNKQPITQTDWQVNKKIANKNRLISYNMVGPLYDEVPIIAQLSEAVEIKQLLIGFNNFWTDYSDKILGTPSSVIVEAADLYEDGLEAFSYLCSLERIEDECYNNFSVSVFGKNFSRVGGQVNNFEDCLSSLKTKPVKYLCIRIRRPNVTLVENLSSLANKSFQNVSISLSFLSVNGIKQSTNKVNLCKCVSLLRESSSMNILNKIFTSNQQSALTNLASDKEFQVFIKNSFSTLTQTLLSQYPNIVSSILSNLSKCDDDLGTWITEKLLEIMSLDSEENKFTSMSKLLLAVISESPQESKKYRVSLIHQFTIKNIMCLSDNTSVKEIVRIQNAITLIDMYDKCLQRKTSNIYDFEISTNILYTVIASIKIRLPKINDNFIRSVKILLSIWLFSDHKFVFIVNENCKIGQEASQLDLANYLINLFKENPNTHSKILELLSVIIISSDGVAKLVSNDNFISDLISSFLNILGQYKTNEKDIVSTQGELMTSIIRFLDASADQSIIANKLKELHFYKIMYNGLKDTPNSSNKTTLLFNKFQHCDIEHGVSLIGKLVLGDKQLEEIIASYLINDLSEFGKIKDMSFVYDVLIKLLYYQRNINLCIHLRDNIAGSYLIEGAKLSDAPNIQRLGEKLKSNLLSESKVETLYQKLPQLLPPSLLNEVIHSSWQLALTSNIDGEEILPKFENSISGKGPFLMLLSGCVDGDKPAVIGIFSSKSMPYVQAPPQNNLDKTYSITVGQGDFICYYDDKISLHFPQKHNENVNFIDVHSFSAGGGGISVYENSTEKMYISLQSYSSSYFDFYDLMPLSNEDQNFEVPSDFVLSKTEYWVLASGKLESSVVSVAAFNAITQSSYYKSWNLYNIYRTSPVISVPNSVLVKTLKYNLLKSSNWQLKLKGSENELENNTKMGDVLQNYLQVNDSKIGGNTIIDLEVDAHKFIILQQQKTTSTEEEPPSKPVLSLFESFEEQGGIKKVIEVCLSSIKLWKNQERIIRWQAWIEELNSFSQLPCFFSLVVKNTKLFELLFKILAGQPDVDINSLKPEEKKTWRDEEHNAVRFTYNAIADVFKMSTDITIRETAFKEDFIRKFLLRLELITKEQSRTKVTIKNILEQTPEKVVTTITTTTNPTSSSKKTGNKKKGVGYGSDNTGDNSKWNVTEYLDNTKLRNEQVISLLTILDNFFASPEYNPPVEMAETIICSSLLPILESAFRSGSLLDIGKNLELYESYLKFTRTLASKKNLIACLLDIDQKLYEPAQRDSVYTLITNLKETANLFMKTVDVSKLQGLNSTELNEEQKTKYIICNNIIDTYEYISDMIDQYRSNSADNQKITEIDINRLLSLPLKESYPIFLKDLRFDYMDMKNPVDGAYKHHYASSITTPYTPPISKMVRLAQEYADLANALPIDYTNSIFVRCDKERVDLMKAIVMGASGTPYAHGAYEYDIYFDDSYPNQPPKCNLETTGHGATRFNPNLYNCGKVCLSLLGTWRGQAAENWDPKLSTILQVLVSTQAIIMSEDVYFNEPGYEGESGTAEGDKKNTAYSNIVKYSNIKFAMIEQIQNPSKGFEDVIRRHFYLKRDEIMEEVKLWLKAADQPANYTGLVADHNRTWCDKFKKSKNEYSEMLKAAIDELQTALNSLTPPSPQGLLEGKTKKRTTKRQAIQNDLTNVNQQSGILNLDEVDVTFDDKNFDLKKIDINDEKVRDRWSRYIGAMGMEAVAKQAKAKVFLVGMGGLGVEIAKNVILSGVDQFTIFDSALTSYNDLSAQFFLEEKDIGKNRALCTVNKLQQLNYYVKVDTVPHELLDQNLPTTEEELLKMGLNGYDIIILTECSQLVHLNMSNFAEKYKKKLIIADCYGAGMRFFCDYGKQFICHDKDGEESQDLLIKSISSAEKGIITLVEGVKHNLEDGDDIILSKVEGMDEINNTVHKVLVINKSTISIGDTTKYTPYVRSGILKKIKKPVVLDYIPYHQYLQEELPPLDNNLKMADLLKIQQIYSLHIAFLALDEFKTVRNQLPKVWAQEDADSIIELAKTKIIPKYSKFLNDVPENLLLKSLRIASYTARGQLNPLVAFAGGFVSQEVIKAITGKFMPTNQAFYLDCSEVIPALPEKLEDLPAFIQEEDFLPIKHRSDGLKIVVGKKLLEELKHVNLFMVGSGAIGCELLKNYAMLGIGVGDAKNDYRPGSIILTDPDIIEVSNLNRQFLFREKHLRKPKSLTAAAAALQMNPELKNHIIARLDKVHDGTSHIFTDKFFEELTIVTNALDNVAARRYVDMRCVSSKTPLIESGTLGPKGHVQVIIPNKTESYGSMKDPEEGGGEIPHCTLKMFPEETLHCVEWARDKFSKIFTQIPKNLNKVLSIKNIEPKDPQELANLIEANRVLSRRPKNFEECLFYARKKFEKYYVNDIKQLMYVYPIDAKTKEGAPFWSLPKRPPTPLIYDPKNILHASFVAAFACLKAKTFGIPIPPNPRDENVKLEMALNAAKIDIPIFVPSDEKAKEISMSVEKEKSKTAQTEETKEESMDKSSVLDQTKKIMGEHLELRKDIKTDKMCFPEEFEKDNDANFHIDCIYSMANLRSVNYKLEPMDWITVKIKAGRIVPALATTTACIAGLQSLEVIKIVKKLKIEDYKSVFLNLAVPFLSLSEPGPAPVINITKDLKVTLWDRWEVDVTYGQTLQDIMDKLLNTYKLEPKDVFIGSQVIYLKALAHSKDVLQKSLKEIFGLENEKYLDLTITFANPAQPDQVLKETPPVRLKFIQIQ